MDLVRVDRVSDPEMIKYFNEKLKNKSSEMSQIKSRIASDTIDSSLYTQLQYFSKWEPSIIHLATSCKSLQNPAEISKRLNISEDQVYETLNFLLDRNLVTKSPSGNYLHNGKSLHLGKDELLHPIFQKARRELGIQKLNESRSEFDLRFSSAFTTSKKHQADFRERLLHLIDNFHKELSETESQEVTMLIVDFFQIS